MRSEAAPQLVFETIADLRNHLDWSGERAADEKFKLLSLEAPEGPAAVSTSFTSSGTAENGTFRDRSEVAVATPPTAFVIETDAHLDRTCGRPWEAHFSHRYDIAPDGGVEDHVHRDDRTGELRPLLAAAKGSGRYSRST